MKLKVARCSCLLCSGVALSTTDCESHRKFNLCLLKSLCDNTNYEYDLLRTVNMLISMLDITLGINRNCWLIHGEVPNCEELSMRKTAFYDASLFIYFAETIIKCSRYTKKPNKSLTGYQQLTTLV